MIGGLPLILSSPTYATQADKFPGTIHIRKLFEYMAGINNVYQPISEIISGSLAGSILEFNFIHRYPPPDFSTPP